MGIDIFLMIAMLAMSGISAWMGYSCAADMLNTERDVCRQFKERNNKLMGQLDSTKRENEKLKNRLSEYEPQSSKSGSIKDDVRKITVVM